MIVHFWTTVIVVGFALGLRALGRIERNEAKPMRLEVGTSRRLDRPVRHLGRL